MRALVAAFAVLAAAPPALGQADGEQRHVINLRNVDIHAFIEDVSVVTGFTFIPHPEVRGNVTVTSQTPLTTEEVFEVFLATMRNQGYAVIPSANGAYRIVPEGSAAQNSGIVGVEAQLDDEFVTEVIQLYHIDASEAANMVTPLVNHRGQVSAGAANNTIIIVDYAGNIARIRQVLAELDQDRSVVDTVALQNAAAYDVARVINDLYARPGDTRRSEFSAVAMSSANSVLLRGDASTVARARQLIDRMDVASEPTETLRVIRLQNADAAEIVPVLEAVARTMSPPAGGEQTIEIPFDPATNSLVLAADPQTLNAMVRVVEELDVRRAQVLVEAIIVEISDGLARDLGLQFLFAGDEDSSVPFAATNFSRSAPNLLAITGALTVRTGEGDDEDAQESLRELALSSILASDGALLGVGGQNDDGLFGVILNAVEDDADSNVLSTPSIVTLDNAPARFLVGQEIPITTGEALGANNSNPFRTIERRDVGVQLEVTPQINEGDTVQLHLRQEVSSVAGPVGPTFGELVTNKREIETTALADNGEIIVIGGLIESREVEGVTKVPLLGDIPVAGRVFSSRTRERSRTNLMVFIRSTIIRDSGDARRATQRGYGYIDGGAATLNQGAGDFDALLRDTLGDLSVDR